MLVSTVGDDREGAALVESLAAGRGIRAGARAAAGEVSLEQMRPWFDGLMMVPSAAS